MREILFRGKTAEGKWVYGYYVVLEGLKSTYHYILTGELTFGLSYEEHEIISETVGQYTGLTDKNGTKIFEGDIVEIVTVDTKEKRKFVVEIGECLETNEEVCCYAVHHRFFGTAITFPINHMDLTEVIGNIHDNK
jgi:uncharacterized phage protein (TIGR01671 family)